MRILIATIFIAFTSTTLFAQLENIPLITVFGESAVKVKPDHLILGFKVNGKISVSAQAKTSVLEIFNDRDINIRLFDFNDKDITRSLTQLEGFVYIKEIFVTINELDKLDRYLLELYEWGCADYFYMDFRSKKIKESYAKGRREAINSAKEKATLIANELEQTIGKAHFIEEVSAEDYNWYNIHNDDSLENRTLRLGKEEYIVQPGYIVISSYIKVSFNLK